MSKLPTVLYFDDALVVAVKEAGVLSQKEFGSASDMVSLLSEYFREMAEPSTVFPVHRLDRGVGGVMVYARTKAAAAALSASFADHERTEKQYLAVVCGAVAEQDGEWEDTLFYDERKRRASVVAPSHPKGKSARLAFCRLGHAAYSGKEYTLLSIRLYTGRTHQIRIQCSCRGFPLAGDGRYGAHDRFPAIALFSARLSFPHPRDGSRMSFCASPPSALPFTLFSSCISERSLS